MSQLHVSVNGKSYPLACAPGEEDRLKELAAYVDGKTKDLTSKLGHVSENRLLLMAAVLIADELQDAREGNGESGHLGAFTEDDVASVINEVASEVEAIAEKLENA